MDYRLIRRHNPFASSDFGKMRILVPKSPLIVKITTPGNMNASIAEDQCKAMVSALNAHDKLKDAAQKAALVMQAIQSKVPVDFPQRNLYIQAMNYLDEAIQGCTKPVLIHQEHGGV